MFLYAFALNIMNKFNYHHIIIVLESRCVLAKRKILSVKASRGENFSVSVGWWSQNNIRRTLRMLQSLREPYFQHI